MPKPPLKPLSRRYVVFMDLELYEALASMHYDHRRRKAKHGAISTLINRLLWEHVRDHSRKAVKQEHSL